MSFHRARIEELPFDDGSFDAVISNGVINLSHDKRKVFAEAARVLRPGGRLALSDIVTERQIAARTACQADLWAACIAGASQRDLYLQHIAAAGLELQVIQRQPGYRFTSERAQRTSHKYGAHSVSLLALKPAIASRHISDPNPGGGARVVARDPDGGSHSHHTHRGALMSAVTHTIRNGVDTEKMFNTLDLIKAQPELAQFQFRATNRWIDGLTTARRSRSSMRRAGRTPPAARSSSSMRGSRRSCSVAILDPIRSSTCSTRSPHV